MQAKKESTNFGPVCIYPSRVYVSQSAHLWFTLGCITSSTLIILPLTIAAIAYFADSAAEEELTPMLSTMVGVGIIDTVATTVMFFKGTKPRAKSSASVDEESALIANAAEQISHNNGM